MADDEAGFRAACGLLAAGLEADAAALPKEGGGVLGFLARKKRRSDPVPLPSAERLFCARADAEGDLSTPRTIRARQKGGRACCGGERQCTPGVLMPSAEALKLRDPLPEQSWKENAKLKAPASLCAEDASLPPSPASLPCFTTACRRKTRVGVVAEARPPQRPAWRATLSGSMFEPSQFDHLALSRSRAASTSRRFDRRCSSAPFATRAAAGRHAQVRDAAVERVHQTRRLGRVGDVSEKGQLGPRLLDGCAPLLFGHGGHDAQEGAVAVESCTHCVQRATRWQLVCAIVIVCAGQFDECVALR